MNKFIKKKWNIDTCHNIDEPWKHYAKRKKPVTKDHILYDSPPIPLLFKSKIEKSIETESRLVYCLRWGEGETWGDKRYGISFWGNENFWGNLKLTMMMVCTYLWTLPKPLNNTL